MQPFDMQTMPRHIVNMMFDEIVFHGEFVYLFQRCQKILDVYGGWSDDPQ